MTQLVEHCVSCRAESWPPRAEHRQHFRGGPRDVYNASIAAGFTLKKRRHLIGRAIHKGSIAAGECNCKINIPMRRDSCSSSIGQKNTTTTNSSRYHHTSNAINRSCVLLLWCMLVILGLGHSNERCNVTGRRVLSILAEPSTKLQHCCWQMKYSVRGLVL